MVMNSPVNCCEFCGEPTNLCCCGARDDGDAVEYEPDVNSGDYDYPSFGANDD